MAEVGGNEERKRKRWILLAPGNQLLPPCHWLAHLHNHDDDDDDYDNADDDDDDDDVNCKETFIKQLAVCNNEQPKVSAILSFNFS